MLIGYARVSTEEQSLDLQVDNLTKAGCERIFSDKASGARGKRQGLEDAIDYGRRGDTIVVWRLDRLGRSLPHLVSVVKELSEKGIHFRSLSEGLIDTTSASGEFLFNIFSILAQFERRLIQERTKAGLKSARARGKKGGRPRSMTAQKVKMASKLMQDTENCISDICATLNVSKRTLYRYVGPNGEIRQQ